MLSLLKLLIALNTFSYRGLFATNCSRAGRGGSPHSMRHFAFCSFGFGKLLLLNEIKITEKVTLAKSFLLFFFNVDQLALISLLSFVLC